MDNGPSGTIVVLVKIGTMRSVIKPTEETRGAMTANILDSLRYLVSSASLHHLNCIKISGMDKINVYNSAIVKTKLLS